VKMIITALAAAALLVAGCSSSTTKGTGSGGSTAAGSSTGAAPTSSAPASSAAGSASAPPTTSAPGIDEKARIAGIPIQAGELPSGWKAEPVDKTSAAQDAAQQAEVARCIGGKNTSADRLARSETDWVQGDDRITSNAQAMRTEADVQADIALFKSPKASSCNEQAARKAIAASLPRGATVTSLKLTITPGTGGGPSNVVAVGHAVVAVLTSGQTVRIYEDFFLIAGKRIEAEVDFTGIGHHIDAALQKQAVSAVADRAAVA
jgi:hypothetical protein